MTSKEIVEYYDATADRDIRSDLKQAIKLIDEPKIAIDCGCGAGRDIEYLLANGFVVHAFDIEEESILRCRDRFKDNASVFLSQDSFNNFSYPLASLVLADASLFFCPESDFNEVWCKIKESLTPEGIFVGSFLGPNDTMAGPEYSREAFWLDVLVFTEVQLRLAFGDPPVKIRDKGWFNEKAALLDAELKSLDNASSMSSKLKQRLSNRFIERSAAAGIQLALLEHLDEKVRKYASFDVSRMTAIHITNNLIFVVVRLMDDIYSTA